MRFLELREIDPAYQLVRHSQNIIRASVVCGHGGISIWMTRVMSSDNLPGWYLEPYILFAILDSYPMCWRGSFPLLTGVSVPELGFDRCCILFASAPDCLVLHCQYGPSRRYRALLHHHHSGPDDAVLSTLGPAAVPRRRRESKGRPDWYCCRASV